MSDEGRARLATWAREVVVVAGGAAFALAGLFPWLLASTNVIMVLPALVRHAAPYGPTYAVPAALLTGAGAPLIWAAITGWHRARAALLCGLVDAASMPAQAVHSDDPQWAVRLALVAGVVVAAVVLRREPTWVWPLLDARPAIRVLLGLVSALATAAGTHWWWFYLVWVPAH